MEKIEVTLYATTIFSLIIVVYLVSGVVTGIPNIANWGFISLTGNVVRDVEGGFNIVLDIENNFKIGDPFRGDIVVTYIGTEEAVYGLILLTKNNEPIITKTFNLNDVLNKDKNSGMGIIKIEELIDYRFEEAGDYELFFSVLDLNINIKREIIVE
ncbi:hypothetical protein COY00_00640 [Candidatus Pacearchaeota archaeon CG_4_10_14_0_2_um_filter_35_33]|nr:hypothetical protein [Candidatus Pacearchaeota archaeon]OIO42523.1 MAG: hypothetical protein AUJ63_02465 [Candidatus Pacearchaeota archaeon CG1_02_35_32]PIY81419.1 MAG: hypothetical protein COY79_02805 [Candidatus Pacearchaeota archaeon CG_4_10_14_0_8_um_filter_35_169]PIZ80617.1 MAG: hypothetical protein COY00_00640 [Candidatus Pacearchaeota archaeon CG_4_10_14_0_2_um_filter_35_33]PJA70114.1 MAG: hypothetical protein CO155_01605 [Candidatus Pacearchaeota archaeon CG_4_9_14_3_um_filter_35_19]